MPWRYTSFINAPYPAPLSSIHHRSQVYFSEILCRSVLKYLTKKCNELIAYHNLCKQIGPRTGMTKCRSWSGCNLFDTQLVFLKNFSIFLILKKIGRQQKAWKISQGQGVNVHIFTYRGHGQFTLGIEKFSNPIQSKFSKCNLDSVSGYHKYKKKNIL